MREGGRSVVGVRGCVVGIDVDVGAVVVVVGVVVGGGRSGGGGG